jgi:hypothetical protein
MKDATGQVREAVFEVIWHQHNPDDWMAEVLDLQTGVRRRVSSLQDLALLLNPDPQEEAPLPAESS